MNKWWVLSFNSIIPLQWIKLKLLNLFFYIIFLPWLENWKTWSDLVHPLKILLQLIVMFCSLNSTYFLTDTMEFHPPRIEEIIFFSLWCGVWVVPRVCFSYQKRDILQWSFFSSCNCYLGLLLVFICGNRCNATIIRN